MSKRNQLLVATVCCSALLCAGETARAHLIKPLAVSEGSAASVGTKRPWIGAYTLAARVDLGKLEASKPIFATTASSNRSSEVTLVMTDGKLRLRQTLDDRTLEVVGKTKLPSKGTVHVAAVQEATGPLLLFVDGKLDNTTSSRGVAPVTIDRVTFNAAVTSGRFFPGPLSDKSLATLAESSSGELAALDNRGLNARVMEVAHEEKVDYYDHALRVQDGAPHPIAAGLKARVVVVPPREGELPGLVTYSAGFGASLLYFPGAKISAPQANPDQLMFGNSSAPMPRIAIYGSAVEGAMFPYTYKGRDGQVTAMKSPLSGLTDLFFLPHVKDNAYTFGEPQPIRFGEDSKPFSLAHGYGLNFFGDVDGDGVPDLLLTKNESEGSYYPDAPKNFWTGEKLPNSGPGKGYTVNDVWLGEENVTSFHWARGQRREDGSLDFGEAKAIIQGDEDFVLRWKGHFGSSSAGMMIDGKPYLILTGDLDRILAIPIELRHGVIHCGPAANLLPGDQRIVQCYITSHLVIADMDADGKSEIVISGNPGSVVVLTGDTVGRFSERQAYTTGGFLAMQTLVVPCREDWDRDGTPDIVAGDASGWMMFFPGTSDPKLYGSPKYFTVDGKRVQAQAGYRGSIQGPNEARWGYLNPTVCDWDDDGQNEIITCDIRGDLFLWKRKGRVTELSPPLRFMSKGKPLPVAWRQRVAFVPGEERLAGDDRPCLLIQDYDGDLALAVPTMKGSAEIERVTKLRYADGQTILTCGPTGCWGRSKFLYIDWDGDGVKDVIYSTNRASNKFIIKEDIGHQAVPLFLRNVGTTAKPVFARPAPLKFKGENFNFGTHIAACWPFGHGLMVGGEDGRIYAFERSEIRP